jgi:hypothetical protein
MMVVMLERLPAIRENRQSGPHRASDPVDRLDGREQSAVRWTIHR